MLPTERFIKKRGSQLISSMFNNVFYGIAMCMVFQYFRDHAHRDNLNIKLVVYLLVYIIWEKHGSRRRYSFFSTGKDHIFSLTILTQAHALHIYTDLPDHSGYMLLKILRNAYMGYWEKYGVHRTEIEIIGDSSGFAIFNTARCWARQISITFESLRRKRLQIRKIITTQGAAMTICDIVITASITYILQASRSGINKRVSGVLTIFLVPNLFNWPYETVNTWLLKFHYNGSTFYFISYLVVHVMSVISLLISRETIREQLDQSHNISDLVLATRTSNDDLEGSPQAGCIAPP
ncbi:hypothetical protein BDQ17DRAFT_1418008 [Cyathus striatus]|nr:hypothetical protein BDQ17DRAFT_1418008 [Cyathus striatus]